MINNPRKPAQDVLRRVRLELAREPDHPNGDSRTGYEIVLPLDSDRRIDPEQWHRHREACRVRRFAPGKADAVGRLARKPGGAWYLDYAQGTADDEAGFRLGDEHFVIGEYVSIADDRGHMHAYRVVAAEPL